MSKEVKKAYLMAISSMLLFGTIGIFRRAIPISSALLACIRGLVGSLVLLGYVQLAKGGFHKKIDKKNGILLVICGALIGLNWISLFEAYNYTTVAKATLCYYMAPTIVILLSPMVLKEKLTWKKLICVALSIIGMVLVSGVLEDYSASGNSRGILLGLLAAALYSSVILLNKKIHVEDNFQKTIIQLFSAAAVVLPYLIISKDFDFSGCNGLSFVLILIVGVIHTGVAYALYFSSLSQLPAQSVALLSYIDPVSALLLSSLFLNEKMTAFGLIGAVLIIGSAITSEIKR